VSDDERKPSHALTRQIGTFLNVAVEAYPNLRRDGKKVVGARRGDGKTVIRVETGSGDCVISPRQKS